MEEKEHDHEVEEEEKRQVFQLELEHKRLLSGRLARARASKDEISPTVSSLRDLISTPMRVGETTVATHLDPEDEQDAREETQTLLELRLLREQRRSRAEAGAASATSPELNV